MREFGWEDKCGHCWSCENGKGICDKEFNKQIEEAETLSAERQVGVKSEISADTVEERIHEGYYQLYQRLEKDKWGIIQNDNIYRDAVNAICFYLASSSLQAEHKSNLILRFRDITNLTQMGRMPAREKRLFLKQRDCDLRDMRLIAWNS